MTMQFQINIKNILKIRGIQNVTFNNYTGLQNSGRKYHLFGFLRLPDNF